MNIIMLSLMFNEKSLAEAFDYSKNGVQMATHLFQWFLYNGFRSIKDIDFSVINVPPIGSFPMHYEKLKIMDERWGKNNCQIGFTNLPIIKRIDQEKKIKNIIESYLSTTDQNYLIVYSLYEPFLRIANLIKEKHPETKLCLIQTDPIFGRNTYKNNMNIIYKAIGNYEVNLAKQFDCYVLLTKYLSDVLEIGQKPYMIMECICDFDSNNSPSYIRKNKGKNICLYSGTLNKVFGICELVEAFTSIHDGELWICGAGDSVNYIKRFSDRFSNIKYFGFVDQDNLAYLKSQCNYLVNPRRPDGTYTMYSFPSKTAEYLLSGIPTIMYKLEGIPDEYDEYLNYLTKNTPEEISVELKNFFNQNYYNLVEKADQAKIFMRNNKSKEIQAKRVLDFLSTI